MTAYTWCRFVFVARRRSEFKVSGIGFQDSCHQPDSAIPPTAALESKHKQKGRTREGPPLC